jgi:hypothetical protein
MKNYIVLIIFFLSFTSKCFSQTTNTLNNSYNLKKSDRYTLSYSDSIKTFIPAKYPGKLTALTEYLDSSLKKSNLTGVRKYNKILYLRITISDKGKVENIEILKNIKACSSCDSIAVSIINNMPDWIPAYAIYKNHSKRKEKDQVLIPLKF